MPEPPASAPEPPASIRELAERRAQARQSRDFAAADQLRAQIGDGGWTVTDGPGGYELAPAAMASAEPAYQVWPDPAAVPSAPGGGGLRGVVPPGQHHPRPATVALLVEGWPDDLRACVAALLAHAPAGVVISALDVGNRDGAGDVLHELSVANPGRIEEWHVATSRGWGVSRNALLRADPARVHVIMETSTILTGDAISPLLAEIAADGIAAAGWRGVDSDPDLRGFHDAGPMRLGRRAGCPRGPGSTGTRIWSSRCGCGRSGSWWFPRAICRPGSRGTAATTTATRRSATRNRSATTGGYSTCSGRIRRSFGPARPGTCCR
jgi:hypothetical protein